MTRASGFTSERTKSATAVNPATTSAPSINSWPRRVKKPRSPGPTPTQQIIGSFLCLRIARESGCWSESVSGHKKHGGSTSKDLPAEKCRHVCVGHSPGSRVPFHLTRLSYETHAHEKNGPGWSSIPSKCNSRNV